jgi:serine/threonine protein kinase
MSTSGHCWRLHEGDLISAELTAMRLLGGGSAYEAYLAFDETTHMPTVVKVLRPHLVDDEHSLRGLAREVETLTTIRHPVVVRALRHQLDGPRPHVVLENIDGPRLSTLIRRHGRLAEAQYLPLALELAAALHYFDHLGLCHLDIKPSNIIMAAPARLIDLSVARPAPDAALITGEIGTDAYMAPEQCDPGNPDHGVPSPASDVWGLGSTLFEAVAGHRPFVEGDPNSQYRPDRYPQLVEPPLSLPAGIPAEVRRVITAALEPNPRNRPRPQDIAASLEPVIAAQPLPRLTFKVNARS